MAVRRAPEAHEWQPLVRALKTSDKLVLTTHVRPDTDGVGSEIALHRYLCAAGKQARIINPGRLLPNLSLLDPEGRVEAFDPSCAEFIREATVIVLDVSERERLGPLLPLLKEHTKTTICIDHHINEDRLFATINLIDPTASATGVLIWELLRQVDYDVDPVCAQALYATIVADTGSFRFSNTTAEVLRLAADLIDLGADPQPISKAVLGTYSKPKVRLLARALSDLSFDCDERLVWCAVSMRMLESVEASAEDAEGLVEYLRLQGSVQAAVFFIEVGEQRVKISFRSENSVDVNRLAMSWGGGGHRHAAGAVVEGPLPEVVDRVVDSARSLFGCGSSATKASA